MRRAGALVLLSLGAALLASCSSLFGLDEYSDSTEELCDLAEKCFDFSACESHVGHKLDDASANARSEWLAAIPSKACLQSCSKSRRCLSISPVCSPYGTPCTREEECCGFVSGMARCQPEPGGAGGSDAGSTAPMVCCRPDGVQAPNKSTCCSGKYNDKNRACGETICRPPKAGCTDDLQCCSGRCDAGTCAEEQCLPLGTPCGPGESCCAGATCLPDRGVCGFPGDCRQQFAPCNTVGADTPCCQGLTCLPAVNKHPGSVAYDGLCQHPAQVCLPKGYACEQVAECCNGLECRDGECRPPCLGVDQPCGGHADCCSGRCEVDPVKGPVCRCAEVFCEQDNDCCGGTCVGGLCVGPCANETVCHDECVPGPPLIVTDQKQCSPKVNWGCVGTVCAKDDYCCCVAWDSVCVTLAVNECGVGVCN